MLREQLDSIAPALREMRLRKDERVKQVRSVKAEIQKISAEIAGRSTYEDTSANITIDDNDLSIKKLEEYQNEVHRLHDEKVHFCNTNLRNTMFLLYLYIYISDSFWLIHHVLSLIVIFLSHTRMRDYRRLIYIYAPFEIYQQLWKQKHQ